MSLVVSEPTLAQILPENDQLVSLLVLADASRRVAKIVLTALENAAAECFTASRTHEFGDAENAGLENAGLENAGTSCVWIAKCNIVNVRGHVRVNVTAGRGDPRTLQEAIQSGN